MADRRDGGTPLLSTYRVMVPGAALGWSILGIGAFLEGRPDLGYIRLTIGLAIACARNRRGR